MSQSLEEYVAQATNAYQPAANAIQQQIDALPGQLETNNQQIKRNYAQQLATINNSRNAAAETASMQAAGSGGSFGGAANIANRKYYDQTFVPAVTQMQTNQANDLATAQQNYENQRTSLNAQLANLQAQANQGALAQYYSDQQLAKQLAAQNAATAATQRQNEYLQRTMNGEGNGAKYYLASDQNEYGGYNWTDANGNLHRAATVAAAYGGNFMDNLKTVLEAAANQGDYYSQQVLNQINNNRYSFARNTDGNSTGNDMYDVLGIKRVY